MPSSVDEEETNANKENVDLRLLLHQFYQFLMSTTDITQTNLKKAHGASRQKARMRKNREEQSLISTLSEMTKIVAASNVEIKGPNANELFGSSRAKTSDEMSEKQSAVPKFRIQQILMEIQLSSLEELNRSLECGMHAPTMSAANYSVF